MLVLIFDFFHRCLCTFLSSPACFSDILAAGTDTPHVCLWRGGHCGAGYDLVTWIFYLRFLLLSPTEAEPSIFRFFPTGYQSPICVLRERCRRGAARSYTQRQATVVQVLCMCQPPRPAAPFLFISIFGNTRHSSLFPLAHLSSLPLLSLPLLHLSLSRRLLAYSSLTLLLAASSTRCYSLALYSLAFYSPLCALLPLLHLSYSSLASCLSSLVVYSSCYRLHTRLLLTASDIVSLPVLPETSLSPGRSLWPGRSL